jgi:glycosyltransferase involved in cell wall biosynthesis
MRVLVVSQYFWPENFRINDLVAELVTRGHEVTVLTGRPNYPDGAIFGEFAEDPRRFSAYSGARVVRVPLVSRGKARGARLAANYLSFAISASLLGPWKLRGLKTDAVFVFEPSPITVGLPAVLLSGLKSAPVALWVLDLWPETLSALGVVRSPCVLAAIGRVVSFIYNRCALVLVQSRAFVPAVLKWSTRPGALERVKYFPSWAESVYAGASGTPAPEVEYRPDLFTVLFAGNIGDAQDFPAILAAAERLKDDARIRWVFVGDGRALDWVRVEVERRGLTGRVLLPGRFPLDRMPSFNRHADALLVSLKADPVFAMTIPGKVQSCLQAGIPVVGMLDGEGARVVQEAEAGIVCPAGDSEGLANAVRRLAAMEPAARAEMGRRGADYAKREFDRDRLISYLESLLASAQRRG